jgi:N-acetylmuramoyl-L-alanine amidase-like
MSALSASRRDVLQFLAGGAAAVAGIAPAAADEKRISRLIGEARSLDTVSKRIDLISAALRGTRYRADTLIGGPRKAEKFVVRDDAFDCVTYCETVLAAAVVRNAGEFDAMLRAIRYHNGVVKWDQRNHYFFEWCRHNVENKTCRWLVLDGAVEIKKTVDTQKGLSKRKFVMRVIPRSVFLAHKAALQTGDIVGFVSQQPGLDYFHTGFVAFAKDGALLLRHASESRHRVLDERMDRFAAQNHVRYVTVLRPLEPPADSVAVKKPEKT